MIDFITTNPISDQFKSVKDDTENFIICHHYQSDLKVTTQSTKVNRFNIYYQDGMDDVIEEIMETYASDSRNKFRFVPVAYIAEALDKIINNISNRIASAVDEDDDSDDEDDAEADVQIICAMEEKVARGFCSYLNKECRNNEVECEAISMLQYSKIPKLEDLKNTFVSVFHTEFIYPEDPIQFGYVCRKYVEGRF